MNSLHFDDALPIFSDLLNEALGGKAVEITIIRDAFGALSAVLPADTLGNGEWDLLAKRLDQVLGKYSPGESQILLRYSDLVDPTDVLESPDRVRLPNIPNTWLVDRLQTNQDWLREPLVEAPPLPTAVAFSIKGGVGRTTAFALWAWYLARLGKNVVLVDFDLEAPGLASTLLDTGRIPDYGLVDWLVETLVGLPDARLLQDCLAECSLSEGEPGRIRVLPAFGKKTQEYVSKLGRIYMPTFDADAGKFFGLAERLLMLLEQLSRLPDGPDAVLLDVRAGLHDIGSAAVTRLGAEVFLFARDDTASWEAYRQLFRHLKKARSIAAGMTDEDLRWRLKMVAAQLEPTEAAKRHFKDTAYETWGDELYDAELTEEEIDQFSKIGESLPEPQIFDIEDSNAPHYPLLIQFEPRVRTFDLIRPEGRPEWSVIETAFGDFFTKAKERLLPAILAEDTEHCNLTDSCDAAI